MWLGMVETARQMIDQPDEGHPYKFNVGSIASANRLSM
jgi:hypothetical protein